MFALISGLWSHQFCSGNGQNSIYNSLGEEVCQLCVNLGSEGGASYVDEGLLVQFFDSQLSHRKCIMDMMRFVDSERQILWVKFWRGRTVTSAKKHFFFSVYSFLFFFVLLSHSKCLLTALFTHIPNVDCIVKTRICLCKGYPVVRRILKNMVVVSLVVNYVWGFCTFQP